MADPKPEFSSPHVAWRTALWSIVGFWAFYFVVNTLHTAFEDEPGQSSAALRRAVVVAVGILITLCLCALLRRLEHKSMPFLVGAVFLGAVPAALAYATVNFTVFNLAIPHDPMIRDMVQMREEHKSAMPAVWGLATSWYFFLVSWGVMYVALSYAAKVGHAERRAAAYRAQAQAAQLRALRYQVNPHFLFNTLNSLSTLVLRQRTQQAERMITNLASFFRASLAGDPTADVALTDEIAMQLLYLDIEKARFPDRLSVLVDVPRALDTARVPGMILQPLVENAIKHGVARSGAPVTVTIRAWADGASLRLCVEDDADGAPSPPGQGLGLENVRARLATRFDGAAGLQSGSRAGAGFRVELTLPLLRDG